MGPEHFPGRWLHPSRRAQVRAPQDEVLDPRGEERGNAARLETRSHGIRPHDSTQAECAVVAAILQPFINLGESNAAPGTPSAMRRWSGLISFSPPSGGTTRSLRRFKPLSRTA